MIPSPDFQDENETYCKIGADFCTRRDTAAGAGVVNLALNFKLGQHLIIDTQPLTILLSPTLVKVETLATKKI